jgi:hypothetical protein
MCGKALDREDRPIDMASAFRHKCAQARRSRGTREKGEGTEKSLPIREGENLDVSSGGSPWLAVRSKQDDAHLVRAAGYPFVSNRGGARRFIAVELHHAAPVVIG